MSPDTFPGEPVAVAPEVSAALATALRQLRHDLGKSMSLQLRFGGEAATDEDRVEALRQDVLHTRRGPTGIVSAFELFDEARRWLVGDADLPGGTGLRVDLSDDEAFRALERAVQTLRGQRDRIEAGSLEGAALNELVAMARQGTGACRALVVRYGGGSGG